MAALLLGGILLVPFPGWAGEDEKTEEKVTTEGRATPRVKAIQGKGKERVRRQVEKWHEQANRGKRGEKQENTRRDTEAAR
jgi:hypothetical protein